MSEQTFPVFVMCGSDARRRELLQIHDPGRRYKSKAQLPFMGKRLIDWQLEALRASPYVGEVYLLGLTETDILFDDPVRYVPTDAAADFPTKLLDGLVYLRALNKDPALIVISSCDAPAMRTEDVNTFFEQLIEYAEYDFVLSLVPEAAIKAVLPEAGRVVARLRDRDLFPGELYAMSPRGIRVGQQAIRDFTRLRREIDRSGPRISLGPVIRYLAKKPSTWGFLLKYALGLATLADGERMVSATFDCKARGIIIDDPGFGMDMDLPEDYERLKTLMSDRRR